MIIVHSGISSIRFLPCRNNGADQKVIVDPNGKQETVAELGVHLDGKEIQTHMELTIFINFKTKSS